MDWSGPTFHHINDAYWKSFLRNRTHMFWAPAIYPCCLRHLHSYLTMPAYNPGVWFALILFKVLRPSLKQAEYKDLLISTYRYSALMFFLTTYQSSSLRTGLPILPLQSPQREQMSAFLWNQASNYPLSTHQWSHSEQFCKSWGTVFLPMYSGYNTYIYLLNKLSKIIDSASPSYTKQMININE
jgi:hypothetical protein